MRGSLLSRSNTRDGADPQRTAEQNPLSSESEIRARIRRRVAMYLGLGTALVLVAILCAGSSWRGSTELHTNLEVLATVLAALVGVVSLARYYAHPENTYLLVGVGFLGTALLDGYHAVVTSTSFDQLLPSPPPSLIPWSWNASRILLSLTMVAIFWARRRERMLGDAGRLRSSTIYVVFTLATLGCFAFFAFVPLPRAYYQEFVLGRPQELIGGCCFAIALIGFLYKGRWWSDPFEHALVCSLIIGCVSQVVIMSRSFGLFDAMFDLAHLLKLVSYLVVLAGLVAATYRLFVQAYSTADALRNANGELAVELQQRGQAQRMLERANDELARSNRELDDFAYIASHDLKEPLRGIHNYASFLLEDYGETLDQDGQDKLHTLTRLSQRMETLIDRLLYYSRVGRMDLDLAETDLQELLDEVLDSLHITIEERGIEIRIPQPLPTLRCDRVRVGEVFQNLIGNAMKFTDKPKPWIEIGAVTPTVDDPAQDAGHEPVQLYVRDNGIGIRDKHLDSIFRIFKRVHSRSKYGGGTGAGLTIAKKIVERHGGRIWGNSVYGEGTTFYFTLAATNSRPRDDAHDAPALAIPAHPGS